MTLLMRSSLLLWHAYLRPHATSLTDTAHPPPPHTHTTPHGEPSISLTVRNSFSVLALLSLLHASFQHPPPQSHSPVVRPPTMVPKRADTVGILLL
jgi:hypothetical protein